MSRLGQGWSYSTDSGEGGAVSVQIQDPSKKIRCSGSVGINDNGYSDLTPHRIADILIQNKCQLFSSQKTSDDNFGTYIFISVEYGYIVFVVNSSYEIPALAFVGDFFNWSPIGNTKYSIKKLWETPRSSRLRAVSTDRWANLFSTCEYSKQTEPINGSCVYSLYDRNGVVLAKNLYNEKEHGDSSTSAWYDSVHDGFLIAGLSVGPDSRRTFNYSFIRRPNNPSYHVDHLATLADTEVPAGKGCSVVFVADKDTIKVEGGCLNPNGHEYPLVLHLSQ